MLVEVYNSSQVIQERSVRASKRVCTSEKHIEEEQDDDDDDDEDGEERGGGVEIVTCLLIMQQVQDTLARFFAGREDLYLLKINTSKVFPIPEPCSCPILCLILTCCKSLLQQGSSP
jgi:hypothetical protein